MKKIYTFFNARALFTLFASSLLTSSAVFGQNACPYPVVQNFNNTGGSTAGFTGFNYGTNNLVKTGVFDFALYSVTSPTFQLPANQTVVGYGFTLGGTERVSKVTVKVQYVVNGEVITVPINPDVSPQYNPQTGTADVCGTVNFADLPRFAGAGGRFRLIFELDPATGGGTAASTITFDDFRSNGTQSLVPLPVTFMNFEAKALNNKVLLTWKVAGEENVSHYEVERSNDGRSFATVGSVSKTGRDIYTYTDANASSTIYYRIKDVDNDGQFKYSTIARIVNGKSELVLRAFPQPVQNRLTVQHPSIAGKALVSVSTADGKTVRTIVPANGSMETSVDMNGLQKGMYFVRFDSGDGKTQTMKVLKQ